MWSLVWSLVLYAALLVWLAGRLPLWLDEVLTLIGAMKPNLHELIQWVGYNPGSSPLGFLVERPLVETMGLTRIAARLPSVLFSVLSAIALVGFAREVGAPARGVLLGAYLVLPIQLRYAVEARPYAMALFFTVAGLWCLWRLMEGAGWGFALLYAVLVAAGLYAQPFAGFVQLGALVALAFSSRRDFVLRAGLALIAGCLLFAPWYLTVQEAWRQEIVRSGYAMTIEWRAPLVLIREIAGGGYWQSVPLILAACLGWRELPERVRRFLLGGIVAGTLGAMAADAVSGYFFATRHALFVIPGLVVLAGAGFASARFRRAGAVLAAVFLAASVAKSWTYFRSGTEDWPGAARGLMEEARGGACVIVPQPEPEDLYAVFEPELRGHFCTADSASGLAAIPVTRYSMPAQVEQAEAKLQARGYHPAGETALPGNVRSLLFLP